MRSRLLERRTVVLEGDLSDRLATELAAQLMTLDATGDDPIALHVNAVGGTLSAALTLIDTMAALGVPVEAQCVGRAEGPALGVFACCSRRLAAPHARLRLCQPELSAEGGAAELERALQLHQELVERFTAALARATRQPSERIEVDLAAGRYFELEEAIAYRLVDGPWTKGEGA